MSKVSKTKKGAQSQMCVWDLTIWPADKKDKNYPESDIMKTDIHTIRTQLSTICKHYCFQLELGEKTGKYHYQARISLKTKEYESVLVKKISKLCIGDFHISQTSSANRKNTFYVMKEETRVSGPYDDLNHIKAPIDVLEMKTLRPWQQSLLEELTPYYTRRVDILIDTLGDIGKTRFCRYMMCYKEAQILPFCREYKDILRMTYDVGEKLIYMLDLPRALPKTKMFEFFSAIETIKSGFAYDDRNTYKQRIFDPPRVIVFTNTMPDTKLLTKDMWKFWSVTKKMELKELNHIESDESTTSCDVHFDISEDLDILVNETEKNSQL